MIFILLVDPWCEQSEYIAKCEEEDKSDDNIYSPSLCFLRILFTITSEGHEYPHPYDCEDAEEEDDIDEVSDDCRKEALEAS